jgi:uncharacterized membrane protein
MPDGLLIGTFIHIAAVFAAAGTSTTFILVLSMMRRARTVQDIRTFSTLGGLAEHAFPFATLILLLSGGYLVTKWPDASWSHGWVSVSAVALVLMAIASLKINTLKMNAIHHAAEDAPDGPVPRELAAMIADPVLFAVTHAITTVMLGIIWNMTTKPGNIEAAIVVVAAALVGAGSAAPMVARRREILAGGASAEPA